MDCRARSGNGCVAQEEEIVALHKKEREAGLRWREREAGLRRALSERAVLSEKRVERAARLRARSGVASEKQGCERCVMRLSDKEAEIVREPLHPPFL